MAKIELIETLVYLQTSCSVVARSNRGTLDWIQNNAFSNFSRL